MRTRCHWLALVTGIMITGGVILLTCLAPAPQPVTAEEKPTCPPANGAYCGAACCSTCHPEQRVAWSSTRHAIAGVAAGFQMELAEASDPSSCYSCHTTGYEPLSGHYAQAGVTCERCHGPYRPGHTTEQMAIADTPDLCGTCHVDRLTEWQTGAHGDPATACMTCHPTHAH